MVSYGEVVEDLVDGELIFDEEKEPGLANGTNGGWY